MKPLPAFVLLLSLALMPMLLHAQGAGFGGRQVITDSVAGAQWVATSDLDGDGDLDVLSASRNDDKIAWYENLGGGKLGHQRVLTSTSDTATNVFPIDLDEDGDPDVLSTAKGDDEILWQENLGGGNFGPPQVITSNAGGANSVYAEDLDNDGDVDVLSTSNQDDKLAWYESQGGGSFSSQKIISDSLDGYYSVVTFDAEGDGDPDLLVSTDRDNKLSWFENLGGGNFVPGGLITNNMSTAREVFVADIDGDGDMDPLSSSRQDHKIAWYENKGNGNFGPQQVITTNAVGAVMVTAGDFDGDGDQDVASASVLDNKVAWYENLGGGSFGPQNVLSNHEIGVVGVFVCDLDADGDVDLFSAARDDGKISWYPNLLSATTLAKGSVYHDANGNGVKDPSEAPVIQQPVSLTSNIFSYNTLTDSSGAYKLFADSGALSLAVTPPTYWQITQPAAGSYADTAGGSPDTLPARDFGLRPIPGIHDLSLTLSPLAPPRPGFSACYQVSYTNRGTEPAAGATIHLAMADTLVFDTATAALSGNDTLSYTLQDTLQPGENGSFRVCFKVPADVNLLGDSIMHWASIVPAQADTTPANNADTLHQLIIGSYDPNDKRVMNSLPGQPDAVDVNQSKIDYMIRFQNTGNASAINVRLEDTLRAGLRPETFEMTAASHPYRLEMQTLATTGQTVLRWFFDGINLPDSNTNEPASHGFVRFTIERDAGLSLGDTTSNRAGIYFDFNPVVLTNDAIGVLSEPNQDVTARENQPSQGFSFTAYPNPTTGKLNLRGDFAPGQPLQLRVMDLRGRTLVRRELLQPHTRLNLAAGVYLIEVRQGGQTGRRKLILR